MSIIFNLFSIPPLACRLLPVLQFCPILRGSNFGWVFRSGHIFDSVYISPDCISQKKIGKLRKSDTKPAHGQPQGRLERQGIMVGLRRKSDQSYRRRQRDKAQGREIPASPRSAREVKGSRLANPMPSALLGEGPLFSEGRRRSQRSCGPEDCL